MDFLKTKPEKILVTRIDKFAICLLVAGSGANLRKVSKKVCTPKLVKAEPKKTGVNSPARMAFQSTLSFPASCRMMSSFYLLVESACCKACLRLLGSSV